MPVRAAVIIGAVRRAIPRAGPRRIAARAVTVIFMGIRAKIELDPAEQFAQAELEIMIHVGGMVRLDRGGTGAST